MVETVADLIAWENAGFATDWTRYDFAIQKLFRSWKLAEKHLENIRQIRHQAWLKSHFKQT